MPQIILSSKDIARFWSKIDRNGPVPTHRPDLGPCWLFRGRLTEKGYGQFSYRGTTLRAHRVAFFLEHGHWPDPFGLHACDNPPCCNAAHIFEGTHDENMDDARAKGRFVGFPAGERNAIAKLRSVHVVVIRQRAKEGVSYLELAEDFGVDASTIGRAVRGDLWKHVNIAPPSEQDGV